MPIYTTKLECNNMEIKNILGKLSVNTENKSTAKTNPTNDVNNKPVVSFGNSDNFNPDDVENKVDFSLSSMKNVTKTEKENPKSEFQKLTEFQKTHSKEETYAYFKETLSGLAKNDKESFKTLVNSILQAGNSHYDYEQKYDKIADSQAEILEKFLTANGSIDNAICSTIHGFMMDTMHELGIDAVITPGTEGGGHATLLYKLEDGKYIFNDYGTSTEINADNIIQAAKISTRETDFNNFGGYTQILGDGSDYYQEYSFKDEAAYGDEIDSKNSNKTTAFKNDNIKEKSGFNFYYDRKSDIKQDKFGGDIKFANEDAQVKASVGVQYRQTEAVTDNFNGSSSIGIKGEIAKNFDLGDKGQITADATVISNSITGTTNKVEKYSLFKEQVGVAYSKDVYKEKDLTLTNAVRFSEDVSFGKTDNFSHVNDIKLQLEDGVRAKKENDNVTFETLINAGIIANYGISDFANQTIILNLGGKANIASSVDYALSDNSNLKASADGFFSADKNHANYGANAEIGIKKNFYNPHAVYPNSSIEAAIGYSFERTDINVGGFNQNVQNEHSIHARAVFDLGEKMDIYGNYNLELTKIQHKISVGMKYNFD